MMAMVWLGVAVVWCGCGWRGGPGVRGFATFGHAHIRGLGSPRPWFVARPLSKVERGRPGAGAQATNRGLVCASRGGSGRLASRNGCGESQRELVSLLRVVVECFGGSGAVCVRGSPAGRDAGGAGSGWGPAQVVISQQ